MKFKQITINKCKRLIELNKEGITINQNGEIVNKEYGYYVSITNNTFNELNTLDIYRLLIKANKNEIENYIKTFIGGWYSVNTKKWYIDLSYWVKNKDTALSIAKNHNQEGIFNIKSLETIFI